jgi:hypothetical protein
MIADYGVDQTKWAKLDIFNQMGNIYSEVGRSFKTIGQVGSPSHNAAVSRAIDLFDATIQSQIAAKSPRAKEVLRAKEQFLLMVNDSNASPLAINSLERYFMQFAVAARLKH